MNSEGPAGASPAPEEEPHGRPEIDHADPEDLVPEPAPSVVSAGVSEGFDALAAFEEAEAAQAAEARRHAAHFAAQPVPRPPSRAPTSHAAEGEEGEGEMRWGDLFGDDDGTTSRAAPSEAAGSHAALMTFRSLFGEDPDDDAGAVALAPGYAATQDLPALSLEDLFGEDDDDAPPPPAHRLPHPLRHPRLTNPTDDDADLAPPPELTEIRIPPMPRLPATPGQKLYYVKIPQALHFEDRPYNPDNLQRELDRALGKWVITPDNVVRWRHAGNQAEVESNARVVQWDNGDMHLFVGREVYDISKHALTQDNCFLFARGPDGTHAFQHKFQTGMRVRPTLYKKSAARDLVSRKIRAAFLKKVKGRELRMGLSERAGHVLVPADQQKEAAQLHRKRGRAMADLGPALPGAEDAAGAAEDRERVERLRRIKRAGPAGGVRRGPVADAPAEEEDYGPL